MTTGSEWASETHTPEVEQAILSAAQLQVCVGEADAEGSMTVQAA